jgi:hypothetical protein
MTVAFDKPVISLKSSDRPSVDVARLIRCALACLVAVTAVGIADVSAQVNPRDLPIVAQPQQRFDRGQDVQPIYEGWSKDEDDSITLHFGYLNRNYREQPNVPIGANNYFSPGDEDRGQPTFFYPRTQRYQIEVQAEPDMGTAFEDAVVWTVVLHGSEQKAYAWLQPEWEIDTLTITQNQGMGRGHDVEVLYANNTPTLTVDASSTTVTVGQPVTLTAMLADDELPTVLPPRPRRETLPTLTRPDSLSIPDNVQWYRRPRAPRNGLSVLWVVHHGPSGADFEPSGYQRSIAEEGEDGLNSPRSGATAAPAQEATSLEGDGLTSAKFETTVSFDEPGSYTLRAWATDSMHKSSGDVVITVTE